MSKVVKGIGKIAGAIASVAALIPGLQPIAAIAASIALVANVAAAVTAKKPRAQGAINNVVIQSDPPSPYMIGRTYSAGILRHDTAWGGVVSDVPNPYRANVVTYSVAGPVQGLVGVYADFEPLSLSGSTVTGWFNGFMYVASSLGARPQPTALAANWAGMPNWGATAKLSGKAHLLWSFKFDKKGKRLASGIPNLGAVWDGVKVYDPRLDSTYPGGSGAHRINDETTWAFSRNPGLHGLTYTIGRYDAGKKIFGIGQPVTGIDLAQWVAFANVCDANGWQAGGTIFEAVSDDAEIRWENLKNICAAGGAVPVNASGKIGVSFNAPGVSLATITAADVIGDMEVSPARTWRDRINGIVPKYRSSSHQWEYVPSDMVSIPAYVTDDGEPKIREQQWNLVQDLGDGAGRNQVAQLAGYELMDAREIDSITLKLKPQWRDYRPGEILTVNIPELGLINQTAKIMLRGFSPADMSVTMTLRGETASKHGFALGRTGTAPPAPALFGPQVRDEIFAALLDPAGYTPTMIRNASVVPSLGSLQAVDAGTNATINVGATSWEYPSSAGSSVTRAAGTITGRAYSTTYYICFDDDTLANTTPTYIALTNEADIRAVAGRHYIGVVTTPASGGAPAGGFDWGGAFGLSFYF